MSPARIPRPFLRPGDTVAVVSPGFGVRPAALRRGVARLEALGYRVRVGEHALDRHGYLAGDDDDRAADLDAALRDPEVHAVWFARGGYGSARLLDRIRWDELAEAPKPLVGYSDVTALFATALRRTRVPCLYGPVVAELGDPTTHHLASLRRALRGEPSRWRFGRRRVVHPGRATGRVLGGNLTVLAHLLGTPHAPRLEGAILLVEDVGEPAYRLDRALHHLRASGALGKLRGAIVGSLTPASWSSYLPDRDVDDLVRETFASLRVPVVNGFPLGHVAGKHTLVLGGRGRLDTAAGFFEVDPRR